MLRVGLAVLLSIGLAAVDVAGAAAAEAPPKHAAAPHPGRVVARKHHSGKLLTEAQLRANARKIKHAAKKLMGTKPEELMPTWSTITPLPVKKTTVVDEGVRNLKLQKDVAAVEKHDDKMFHADNAATSGN